MTPEDFKAWRKQMGWTQEEAAEALGLSKPTILNYERGSRRENGRAVEIPYAVALACSALFHGVSPWSRNEKD